MRKSTDPAKNQKDLLLAPVAAEIDRNLQRLRGDSPRDVIAELELELDRPAMYADPDERAALVLRVDGRRERGGGGHACVSPIRWRIGTMTALHDWSGAVAIVGLILRAEYATVPLVTGGIVEP